MTKSTVITAAFVLASGFAGYIAGTPGDIPSTPAPSRKAAATHAASDQAALPAVPIPPWPELDPVKPEDFFQALARDPRLIASRNTDEYPPGAENDEQFYRLLCRWIIRDPQSAAAWMAKQPLEWQTRFANNAGERELFPDTTVELLKHVPPPGLSMLSYKVIFQLPCDPATLKMVVQSRPPLFPGGAMRLLWEKWSQSDGPVAIEGAKRAGLDPVAFREVLTATATTWPEEALMEAGGLDSLEAARATEGILSQLARERPETALLYLKKHPETTGAEDHTMAALEAMVSNGWQFTAETAALFPDKLQPYISVVTALARHDPAAAAAAFAEDMLVPQRDQRKPVLHEISLQYAAADPSAALSWAASMVDPLKRCIAVNSTAGLAVKTDPETVSIWLNSAPPSRAADMVISRLLDQLGDDPEAAYAWAGRFSMPERRESEQARVLKAHPEYYPFLKELLPPQGYETQPYQ